MNDNLYSRFCRTIVLPSGTLGAPVMTKLNDN
jgi:hypothetical protein